MVCAHVEKYRIRPISYMYILRQHAFSYYKLVADLRLIIYISSCLNEVDMEDILCHEYRL